MVEAEKGHEDIRLQVGIGLTFPLVVLHGLAALAVIVLRHASLWITAVLLLLIAISLACRLRQAKCRQSWRLFYDRGSWLLRTPLASEKGCPQGQRESKVCCSFSYATSWMVAIAINGGQLAKAETLVVVPAATSAEEWRRLHALIRDGRRSDPERQS
ncbi:MAG: protein YgfX [Porticoccaceae bacterium]